jgi:hypothetical protein
LELEKKLQTGGREKMEVKRASRTTKTPMTLKTITTRLVRAPQVPVLEIYPQVENLEPGNGLTFYCLRKRSSSLLQFSNDLRPPLPLVRLSFGHPRSNSRRKYLHPSILSI